jgi:hypothetical protein
MKIDNPQVDLTKENLRKEIEIWPFSSLSFETSAVITSALACKKMSLNLKI